MELPNGPMQPILSRKSFPHYKVYLFPILQTLFVRSIWEGAKSLVQGKGQIKHEGGRLKTQNIDGEYPLHVMAPILQAYVMKG